MTEPETDALARFFDRVEVLARTVLQSRQNVGIGLLNNADAVLDDLAALRRKLQDDLTRSAEPVKAPAPQHAAADRKG